jgi:uncharacterized protein YfdQ (DUF2303 family)
MSNDTLPDIVTEAETIADLARRAAEVDELDPGLFMGDARAMHVVDLENTLDQPRRPKGGATVTDLASVNRLADRWTGSCDHTVFAAMADGRLGEIRAVLNDHRHLDADEDTEPGHGDWSIRHTPRLSEAAARWLAAIQGDAINQRQFAELVEDQLGTILTPDASDLLDVSTTFAATGTMRFSSAINLRNGRQELTYAETEDTEAGASGNVEVPDRIELLLPIYRGGDNQEVTVGLRYRITNGQLSIALRLIDEEAMWTAANESYLEALHDDFTIIAGTRG